MVRSIGIDPGDDAVKVVELDGSYRKTRLLRAHVVAAPRAGTDLAVRGETVAAVAAEAIAEGMRGDVTLGHPCREAVLRTIELPFKGHDAIKKVIKAEIEGEIHSHVVDDMVVDFLEIGASAEGATRVLVASVPKEGLRTQLDALTAEKIETETIDLDTMALWRVADWVGAFAPTDQDDDTQKPLEKPVTAVVDLGARSGKMLLVEGSQLIDMRALRLGDASIADEISRRTGLGAVQARDAVRACLASGEDQTIEIEEALPANVGAAANPEAPPPPAPRRKVTVTCGDVETAQTAFLQRLARELTRYLTASGKSSRIRSVWVTGGAAAVPGTTEMLTEVFGRAPQQLDVLGKLQHDLDDAVAADLGPRIAVAVGLALGSFGGPEGFQLRQEDLVVTRGFERIKFPLAITCLVGWLALFVYGNKRTVELRNLELQIGSTYVNKADPKAPPIFHGMVNAVFKSAWFEDKQHFSYEKEKGRNYVLKDLQEELVATAVPKRLALIRDKLKRVADEKQKESGVYEDVSLESGLAVLVRWSEILRSVHSQLGRYLVPRLELNMKSGSRRLEFTIAFRGDDFRDKESTLRQAIDVELANPDSPFEKPKGDRGSTPETPFTDTEESGVRGAFYKYTLGIKEAFGPFGPSRPDSDRRAPSGAGGK